MERAPYNTASKPRVIETERLLLRKPKETDAESMFRNWANDPEVTKYLTWNPHGSIEITKQIIRFWLEEEKDPKTIRFVITLKGEGEPIGSIDVVRYIDGNPEIGYCLAKKHWNKGLMTEACKAFIKLLFDLGFHKVLINAAEENVGSNKVIEKCGFKFVRKERREHASAFKPEPVTVNCYELVK